MAEGEVDGTRPVSSLDGASFPWARVAGVLGLPQEGAEVALADADRARDAVREACAAYLEADADRRAGRAPTSAIAAHPDFPTGLGMSLIGASVLWGETEHLPPLALSVAKDQFEMGEDALAASFLAIIEETARPGRDDAAARAAQTLLVAILQRSGAPAQADALARELVAANAPLELWRDDDPSLPEGSMAWEGGALVEGLGPRSDERTLTVEGAQEYLAMLLRDTLREDQAEGDVDER